MATPSSRVFLRLEGLFSVYKPQGVHWKRIRDTIETNLLKGINAAPSPAPQQRVKFLLQSSSSSQGHGDLVLSATSLPALAEHPLVTGPAFRQIKVGVGHRLDIFSSGVLVLGVGNANKALNDIHHAHDTRDYVLEGEFGKATDSFIPSGRLIERSTYDHITRDKLDRVLAMLQGVNQKALLTYSKMDMSSQEAYELAAGGALRPAEKTPPILLGLRCLHFNPPHFTLEVQVMNETQRFLCQTVHQVGLELRSTAVCTGVRRTRDGDFHVRDALTRNRWNAPDVIQAVKQYHASKKARKRAQTHTQDSPAGTQTHTQDIHAGAQVEDMDKLRPGEGTQDITVAALH